jgi:UDPglucose 6-dehydrogenase
LIGELDRLSGEHLERCYRDIMKPSVPVKRMTFENAELAKISLNAFVTTKITFANMLADVCSRMPHGDVDVVTDAIGLDSRIGRKYLTGGLGFGGPCFPRDNVALNFVAQALGARADLSTTTDRLNRASAERVVQDLAGTCCSRDRTVAVLGLAYKPFSHVIEESQAMRLVKALLSRGIRVVAYDALAGPSADLELQGRAVILDSARDCLRQADVVLIATPDPEFTALTVDDFLSNGRSITVVDFWRLQSDRLAGVPRIEYIAYGRGSMMVRRRPRAARSLGGKGAMTPRRRTEPSVGRKILFTAVVIGCVCLAIEGVARIAWWRLERQSLKTHYMRGEAVLNNDAINYMRVPDGLYGYQMKPDFGTSTTRSTRQGFHQREEIPVKRIPGSLRIVCLGESTTFGTTDLTNYPAFLKRIPRDAGHRVPAVRSDQRRRPRLAQRSGGPPRAAPDRAVQARCGDLVCRVERFSELRSSSPPRDRILFCARLRPDALEAICPQRLESGGHSQRAV